MHICIIINATEILTLTIIKQVYPLQKNLIRNTKQKNDLNLCICNSSDSFNNLPCYPSDSHQSQNAVYWRTGMRVTWALLKLPVYHFSTVHHKNQTCCLYEANVPKCVRRLATVVQARRDHSNSSPPPSWSEPRKLLSLRQHWAYDHT